MKINLNGKFALITGSSEGIGFNIAKTLQDNIVIQGNLDPLLLVTGGAKLKNEVNHILENLAVKPFIFNLGHGITPDANPDNVTKLLGYIRDQ